MDQILQHPWLSSVHSHRDRENDTSKATESKLTMSPSELLLASNLAACGFDVEQILEAVHSNSCNQLSALWHLLLEKKDTPKPKVENIFENIKKSPASSAQNPLLKIASLDKDKNTPPLNHRPKSADILRHFTTKIAGKSGRRKHEVPAPVTSSPLRLSVSNGLLRISERMKNIGIVEEDEKPMSPLVE